MDERLSRMNKEFGAARIAWERGGGYIVSEGRPQIHHIPVKSEETILLGGAPKETTWQSQLTNPIDQINSFVSFTPDGDMQFHEPQPVVEEVYRINSKIWVTTHVEVEEETGVIKDYGYYQTVSWYEWRQAN